MFGYLKKWKCCKVSKFDGPHSHIMCSTLYFKLFLVTVFRCVGFFEFEIVTVLNSALRPFSRFLELHLEAMHVFSNSHQLTIQIVC